MKRPLTILVVDDDSTHQLLMRHAVQYEDDKTHVDFASSGAECVDAVRRQQYDCIVLDFNLPDTTADLLLNDLSQLPFQCPIIVSSSSRDQGIAVKSYRNGSVDFVQKDEAQERGFLRRRIEDAVYKNRRLLADRRRIERRNRRLSMMADRDPMTQLYNRRFLNRILAPSGRPTFDRRGNVSIIMIDIDHFKAINDTFGHAAGDKAIRTTADVIRSNTECRDIACRYGGEEFVVLRASSALAESVAWAEKFRRDISNLSIDESGRNITFTCSVGVASVPARYLQLDSINHADAALYLAKQQGRNRTCTWDLEWIRRIIEAHGNWDAPPAWKFRELMEEIWNNLGTTQREHLTRHSDQVRDLSGELGRSLQLDAQSIRNLRIAGQYHDIGKVTIPEDILGKPNTLSYSERRLVERHSADGETIARWLHLDDAICQMIGRHHERFEAKPALSDPPADTIALGSQIISAADALAAMTSERPYQHARTFDDAREELIHESGRQFAPAVVHAIGRLRNHFAFKTLQPA